jgi:hypothetical protein
VTIWWFVECRISKATRAQTHACARANTDTHTQTYVILIAFPCQQLLRERASVLLYTYIACLVPFPYSQRIVSAVPIQPFYYTAEDKKYTFYFSVRNN